MANNNLLSGFGAGGPGPSGADRRAGRAGLFFLTGGPYTQQKNSPQIIWASQWIRTGLFTLEGREYAGAGRFEWGLTGRWELDFEFGVAGFEEKLAGVMLVDESGAAHVLLGVRYRLLDESLAPFTFTLGGQQAQDFQ